MITQQPSNSVGSISKHSILFCTTSAIITTLFLSSLVSAGPSPAAKCEAAKLKEAGKYGGCRLSADSKAVRKSLPAADYAKCDLRLSSKWQKIEARAAGACPTSGDKITIAAEVMNYTTAVAASLAGTALEQAKCEAAKLKEAGKYGGCRLSADSKAVKKSLPAADYAKCDLRFSGKWQGIEIKPPGASCPTMGDEAAIRATITNHTDLIAQMLLGATVCGNGRVEGSELCDDGGESATCDADCTVASCGDGTLNTTSGEACELDSDCPAGQVCNAACVCTSAQCPGVLEIERWAGVGETACVNNADCPVGTCNPGLGRCVTVSEVDRGWTGWMHNEDINEHSRLAVALRCTGFGPLCGECAVSGLDPAPGNCRCEDGRSCMTNGDCLVGTCKPLFPSQPELGGQCVGDNQVVCDEPFGRDVDDCGGGMCNCYEQPPVPVSNGNLPSCLVNLYDDLSGTVDVDLGVHEIATNLKSRSYLGINLFMPCPVCGGTCVAPVSGKCSEPTSTNGQACNADVDCNDPPASGNGFCRPSRLGSPCATNEDCDVIRGDGDGVCSGFDPVARDGVRGGTCAGGNNDGLPCDVDAVNTSFPVSLTSNGGGYSLDCLPDPGKNVSGTWLPLHLVQTTGDRPSLSTNVTCAGPLGSLFGIRCHCNVCTSFCADDPLRACTSDYNCTGGKCVRAGCSSDDDCVAAVGLGSTCSATGGSGAIPKPNGCDPSPANGGDGIVGLCDDLGNGEGECHSSADDDFFCDGIVRANGNGFLNCIQNGDCAATTIGWMGGSCTLAQRRSCFTDTITASGVADPSAPVYVTLGCTMPAASSGVNAVGGIPGPIRTRTQATATLRCAGTPGATYMPGVGGCQ